MSEVNVCLHEWRQRQTGPVTVLKNVQLVEPEPDLDGGDDNSTVNASQVLLFRTVGPPTDELPSGTGLALDEGSNEERRTEGGPCQRPALSPTQISGGG